MTTKEVNFRNSFLDYTPENMSFTIFRISIEFVVTTAGYWLKQVDVEV